MKAFWIYKHLSYMLRHDWDIYIFISVFSPICVKKGTTSKLNIYKKTTSDGWVKSYYERTKICLHFRASPNVWIFGRNLGSRPISCNFLESENRL